MNYGATFAWRIDASVLMEMVPRVEEAQLHYAAFTIIYVTSHHPFLENVCNLGNLAAIIHMC